MMKMGLHSVHSMDIFKKRKRKQSQITKKNVLQNDKKNSSFETPVMLDKKEISKH